MKITENIMLLFIRRARSPCPQATAPAKAGPARVFEKGAEGEIGERFAVVTIDK